jgi:hypothetical protein
VQARLRAEPLDPTDDGRPGDAASWVPTRGLIKPPT